MRDATQYGAGGAESCPRSYWTAPTPFDPAAPIAGDPVAAFVNEGRWIVSCTAAQCGGAQLASLTDPRFMCVTCGNTGNGGAWLPVDYPAEMPGIVAVLEARTDPREQNWLPGETVADLLAENVVLADDPPATRGVRT